MNTLAPTVWRPASPIEATAEERLAAHVARDAIDLDAVAAAAGYKRQHGHKPPTGRIDLSPATNAARRIDTIRALFVERAVAIERHTTAASTRHQPATCPTCGREADAADHAQADADHQAHLDAIDTELRAAGYKPTRRTP